MFIKKVWENKRLLRNILKSVYFNFHYLPFKQAVHLPILLYKPKLRELKGTIRFDCKVKFGMVFLGFPYAPIYPNSGIMFQNLGGTIVFKGSCNIGNSRYGELIDLANGENLNKTRYSDLYDF